MSRTQETPSAQPSAGLSDYVELSKPRITLMVVVSAAAGFYLGAVGSIDFAVLLHAMVGTALVASGASALNQVWEIDTDARMERTRDRPLPSGRMSGTAALVFGMAIAGSGTAYLLLMTNALTSWLGAFTLGLYVLVYTPLKRVSSLCTIAGAVPGALPPVMGWTAATGTLSTEAWVLFAVMFFWQMPHFLAIAWMYRGDYEAGGQPMLPVIDPTGDSTSRQICLYGLALLPVSLLPSVLGLTGQWYFLGALILGSTYLGAGIHTARARTVESARQLLRTSVIYLPLLFALMTVDKVPL